MSSNLRPAAINFFDDDGDIDFLAFKIAKENHKRKKEEDEIQERANNKKTRPYSRRKKYPRIDPKLSARWIRYVIDENRTWRDVNHKDGKLSALRFSFDFDSVQDIDSLALHRLSAASFLIFQHVFQMECYSLGKFLS